MRTYACTKTVGYMYSYTEQARPSFWSRPPIVRDLMPNVGKREKGSKCGSLSLNAGVSRSMRESWQLC